MEKSSQVKIDASLVDVFSPLPPISMLLGLGAMIDAPLVDVFSPLPPNLNVAGAGPHVLPVRFPIIED